MDPKFRVAIIGGGIGGLFAALSIHHHCPLKRVEVDVYEQAKEYSEIGAGVGIGPNAALLIEKLDLLEETSKIAGKQERIRFTFRRYDNGEEILEVPAPEKGYQLSMHRAEFLDVLVQAVQRRKAARLHSKKKCQKLEDLGKEMLVTFIDGTQITADLVIGADGIHSSVRASYINDDAQYGDMVVYRGLCEMSKIQDTWPLKTYSTLWMAPGRHFLTYAISNNKTLNIAGFVSTAWEDLGDAKESWTLACDKSEVRRQFKDFAPLVQSILDKMDADPLKWVLFDRQPYKEWIFAKGKVALLGDAAHSMCPHQGAGAGQALEDGYILGRALQDHLRPTNIERPLTLDQSLRIYESVRSPRAEKVQVTSRQAGKLYEMQANEVADLSYDAGIPVVKEILKDRVKWIWFDDIDQKYEQARKAVAKL